MTSSRYPVLLFLLLSIFPVTSPLASESNHELVFGFLPSRSAVNLIRHYKPLLDYLSQKLHRRIIPETAADYPTFLKNTRNRHYDFVLTAPHFALLALDSGKYRAPITYNKGLMVDILVRKNSPIHSIHQLAGKKVSLPPRGALITIAGIHFLRQKGLVKSRRPLFIETNSHNDSVHTLLAGETDAAVVSANISRQFLQKQRPVRRLASTGELPGMAILVAKDLPGPLQTSFIHTLVEMKSQPDGRIALKQMGYTGYRSSHNHEFEAARPYLRMFMDEQHTSSRE